MHGTNFIGCSQSYIAAVYSHAAVSGICHRNIPQSPRAVHVMGLIIASIARGRQGIFRKPQRTHTE